MTSNTRTFQPVSIFFFLLCTYLAVSIFFESAEGQGGGLVNQMLAGMVILYSGIKVFFTRKPINAKGKGAYNVLFLFLLYLLIRLAVMVFTDFKLALSSVRNEITILFWVMCFLFCLQEFHYADLKAISKWTRVLIFISFVLYFYSIFIRRSYLESIDKIGADNTAGSAYMLVPLVLLVLKGKMKYVGYVLCLIICAFSQKRQALLGFGLISIFMLVDLGKAYFKTFRMTGIFYLLLAIALSGTIFTGLFSGIVERQQYLEDKGDSDSGRTMIWELAISGYAEAPLSDQLFGGGPGAGGRYVQERTGGWFVMPHNGYIEVLCDYGLIGLLLYIVFFISLLKLAFKFPRGSLFRKILLGVCLAWIMSNAVSHAGGIWIVFLCIAVGIMLNVENEHKKFIQLQ